MNQNSTNTEIASIEKLFDDLKENCLFTYKVQHDGGSAPNPYNGVCTLAICKPAIRRTAKKGDVIVGFGCKSNGDNELRIVYCMVVDEVIEWEKYIQLCSSGQIAKIPKDINDPGDCIWTTVDATTKHDPLPSWSDHKADDFQRDIVSGQKVLLSKNYWYFGSNKLICIPPGMLPPLGRGHRSTSNDQKCREAFETFFCTEINKPSLQKLKKIYGTPWYPPKLSDPRKCGISRVSERDSDLVEEDFE